MKNQEPFHPILGHNGITIRDWFAGMILQGMCASLTGKESKDTLSKIPEVAYWFADKMMEERKKE